MTPQANNRISVHEVLEMVFQNKWIFLTCTFLGLAASWAVIQRTPRWYESEARIEVVDTAVTEPAVTGIGYNTTLVQRFKLVTVRINSQMILEEMARNLYQLEDTAGQRLFPSLKNYDNEQVQENLRNSFYLSLQGPVIRIRSERMDPLQAQMICAEVTRQIQDKMGGVRIAQIDAVIAQLSDLLNKYKGQMDMAEGVLKDFRTLNQIELTEEAEPVIADASRYQLSREQPNALVGRFVDLLDKQQQSEIDLEGLQARLEELQGQLEKAPEEVVVARTTRKSEVYLQLESRLAQANDELAVLSQDRSEQHPLVAEKLEEIERIQRQMEEVDEPVVEQTTKSVNDFRSRINEQINEVRAEIASLKRARENRERQIQNLYETIREIPEKTLQHATLQREKQIQAQRYADIRERYESLKLSKEIEIANKDTRFNLLNKATYEPNPIRPNVGFIYLVGLFGGMLAGVALSFAREFTDTSFRNLEDASRFLDLPVLGVIPEVANVSRRKIRRHHKAERQGSATT